jgi:hypothetical protein
VTDAASPEEPEANTRTRKTPKQTHPKLVVAWHERHQVKLGRQQVEGVPAGQAATAAAAVAAAMAAVATEAGVN